MADVKNVAENVVENAKHKVQDNASELKKSGEDWLHYVQDHPVQSVLFGIIGYYAIKGLAKS